MVMVYLFYIETIQLDNHSWKKTNTNIKTLTKITQLQLKSQQISVTFWADYQSDV